MINIGKYLQTICFEGNTSDAINLQQLVVNTQKYTICFAIYYKIYTFFVIDITRNIYLIMDLRKLKSK